MDTVLRLYWVIYCLFIPIFYVRQALLGYLLSIYSQFFSVRTITQCKILQQTSRKEFIGIFYHLFTIIQTDNYIFQHFPHINIAHIVSWTSNHATYDVYSPEVVETLILGQCYGYCFLYCM